MLEINTHPGMTETSLIPEQAHYFGLPFNDLIKNYDHNVHSFEPPIVTVAILAQGK